MGIKEDGDFHSVEWNLIKSLKIYHSQKQKKNK